MPLSMTNRGEVPLDKDTLLLMCYTGSEQFSYIFDRIVNFLTEL